MFRREYSQVEMLQEGEAPSKSSLSHHSLKA